MNLAAMQQAIREAGVDGWLFYDHHVRDPLAYQVLGLDPHMHVTRRWWYLVPATGEPRKLVHRIESGKLDTLPGERAQYSTWQEMETRLSAMLAGVDRLAMQYSPRNAVMYVAMVDAGTVELLRGMGKQVVSSADLISSFAAVLTAAQIESHYAAQRKIDRILGDAWRHMGEQVRNGVASEFGMMQWLQQQMADEGLVWEHGPNVSVGTNSANPHYDPGPEMSLPIERSDFVLIDLWGKLANDPHAVWYDITWTGVVDRSPTELEGRVFTAVRDARDAAIGLVLQRFRDGTPAEGWEADAAARKVIGDAGFGEWFVHRTGHNITTELHGPGAHLDDFESHDVRRILPHTCFSVEPGIYLPAGNGCFGVRSEINMVTLPGEARVTGRVQSELVRI